MMQHFTLLVLISFYLAVVESKNYKNERPCLSSQDAKVEINKRMAVGSWDQANHESAIVDTSIVPDCLDLCLDVMHSTDSQVSTNGAEPLEQLVKRYG
ncbi:uncharacterized protein PHALS_11477 [Plasmopara halstedii]|uniref:RxLR-like protein n=1 Tax=Plasmopara halstedii TaxID=4781 RepID=A0A0P1A6B9_PLAHL|nr:uncharacterized protein PHALS_11477 [Plasmopara halstedii]CEG35606.1 hypothetical protein PHALS_11477 [Plasmopara halstedii]|eukprot:XP_024571975.1 hypothetical protein PHALS_11477 [Plasmopara halstedii]